MYGEEELGFQRGDGAAPAEAIQRPGAGGVEGCAPRRAATATSEDEVGEVVATSVSWQAPISPDAVASVALIKCRRCRTHPGEVVIHDVDLSTGWVVETRRYASEGAYRKAQRARTTWPRLSGRAFT